MKGIIATLIAISAFTATAGTPEQNATCVTNPPVESLSARDRADVAAALKVHSEHMCASDACEFRVRELANGNTLVTLRAARYADELKQCVTVYMGRAGVVLDQSSKIIDMWPYCYVMTDELKRDPALKKELGYHWCQRPGMRPDSSFKRTPLRGAA